MTYQLLTLCGGIVAYVLCYFALQLAVFHIFKIRELVLTCIVLAFICAFAVWVAFYLVTADVYPTDSFRAVLSLAGLYGSLGFAGAYIILGPLSADRSLSAHMCIRMYRAGGQLDEKNLTEDYIPLIFKKRFEEYAEKGVMERRGGQLHLTAQGARVARLYILILKALRMKENF